MKESSARTDLLAVQGIDDGIEGVVGVADGYSEGAEDEEEEEEERRIDERVAVVRTWQRHPDTDTDTPLSAGVGVGSLSPPPNELGGGGGGGGGGGLTPPPQQVGVVLTPLPQEDGGVANEEGEEGGERVKLGQRGAGGGRPEGLDITPSPPGSPLEQQGADFCA